MSDEKKDPGKAWDEEKGQPPGGDPPPAAAANPGTEAPTWVEFTENTTLHGIKYVFEESTYFRKILWALVILLATGFFVGQVGTRIRDYYEWPSVTSVTQSPVEGGLQFPSVTLCNLNQFRIAQANRLGLYDYLNDQFSTSGAENSDAPPHVDDTSATIRTLGHQLDQLIDICEWQGRPCDLSRDFRTRLLDIGLCHTFNYNTSNEYEVQQTGMKGGLRLLLNIETFEHMRGSNMDSGVKFLLHSPEDVPALQDLGFVATPGQHTLVAIKLSKIINLPDPWGDCVEGSEPVTVCKQKCITDDFQTHCNCSDTHMTPTDTYPRCSLHDKFTCGCNPQHQDITQCGSDCACVKPCEKDVYRPTLSSSMLSSINIDSFALRAPGTLVSTNRTFQEAAEIQLTLSAEHNASYLSPARAVLESFSRITRVHRHYDATARASLAWVTWDLADSLFRSEGGLDPSLLLSNRRDTQTCGFRASGYAVDAAVRLYEMMMELRAMLSTTQYRCDIWWTSYMKQLGCFGYHHTGKMAAPGEVDLTMCDHDGPLSVCDKIYLECVCYLIGYLYGIDTIIGFDFLDQTAMYYQGSLAQYTGIVDLQDPTISNLTDHQTCMTMTQLVGGNTNLTSFVKEMSWLASSILTDTSQYYIVMEYIDHPDWETYLITTGLSEFINASRFGEVCCWPEKYLFFDRYSLAEEEEVYDSVLYRYRSLDINYLMADADDLLASGRKLDAYEMNETMDSIRDYMAGRRTTRELAVQLADPSISRQIYTIVTDSEAKLNLLKSLLSGIVNLQANFEPFLLSLLQDTLVKLTSPDLVASTAVMTHLAKNANETSFLAMITPACLRVPPSDLDSEPMDAMARLVCSLTSLLEEDIAILHNDIKEFELNANALLETLAEFYRATQMGKEFYISNFLQVDLYYEKLEYEEVEQQKAFILASLFGEVGGYMGLLLGASCMTLVELIDYLILVFKAYLRRRKAAAMRRGKGPRKGKVAAAR